MSKNSNGTAQLQSQLSDHRRKVDFDTFDIVVQQLFSMLESGAIDIAPAYQRQFRWDNGRCSQLVESVLLGIPIPSLFMATNPTGSWELVDGVQRISALVKFAGSKSLRDKLGLKEALQLVHLDKLTSFNGLQFSDLPETLQLQFELRPIKVVTLSDKSDHVVRYDLFERLNTGGIALTPQEIRGCVYRGRFSDFLEQMAKDQNFGRVVKLTERQQHDGTKEECVLRFFAYLDNYLSFEHSVTDFLNAYMEESSKEFDYERGKEIFEDVFLQLAGVLPDGIVRPTRKGITPLNLFEAVSVGAALAITQCGRIGAPSDPNWLGDSTLRALTTGATNSPTAVQGRIEFCRDKFLEK